MSYTVEEHPHGVVVRGHVPVNALGALGKAYEDRYDQFDIALASTLGAVAVFTTQEGSKAWRAEIERGNAHLPPLERWARGTDFGISSQTIVHAITGRHGPHPFQPDAPYDADDLGRCIRLFESVPDLRSQLDRVAEVYPLWVPFVREWVRLEGLYREEKWQEVYDLLSACRKEARS